LYSCAASIVDVAARRSVNLPPGLGERLQGLNAELFSGVLSTKQMKQLNSEEAARAYNELNQVEGGAQAAALPVFLALSLATSFAFTQLAGLSTPSSSESVQGGALLGALDPLAQSLSGALKSAAPYLAAPLQALVCVIFTKVEMAAFLEALLPAKTAAPVPPGATAELGVAADQPAAEAPAAAGAKADEERWRPAAAVLLSAGVTAGAYLVPAAQAWPLRNLVNSCIAVTVARGLQLPSLPLVVC
jgi:hypothetical protein